MPERLPKPPGKPPEKLPKNSREKLPGNGRVRFPEEVLEILPEEVLVNAVELKARVKLNRPSGTGLRVLLLCTRNTAAPEKQARF